MGSPQVQPLGLVKEGKPARFLGYDASSWNFSPKVDTLETELEVTNL